MDILEETIKLLKEIKSQTQCIVTLNTSCKEDQDFLKAALHARITGQKFDTKKFTKKVKQNYHANMH